MVSKVVYIIVIILLIIFSYNSAAYNAQHEGIKIGSNVLTPGMDLNQYATMFFPKYTEVTRDKYMFANDASKQTSTQADLDVYDGFIKDLRSEKFKGLVKTFCNKVRPVDICTCEGARDNPEGKDGGNPRPGDDTNYFKINKCTPLTEAANKVIAQKRAQSQHFFGKIPKCCCKDKHSSTFPNGCNDVTTSITPTGKAAIPLVPEPDNKCEDVDCDDEEANQTNTQLVFNSDDSGLDLSTQLEKIGNISIVSKPSEIVSKPSSASGNSGTAGIGDSGVGASSFTSNIDSSYLKTNKNTESFWSKIVKFI